MDEEKRTAAEAEVSTAVIAESLQRVDLFSEIVIGDDRVSFRVGEHHLWAIVMCPQKQVQLRANFVLPPDTDFLRAVISANNCNNRLTWCRAYVAPRDDGRVLLALDQSLCFAEVLVTHHLHFSALMLCKAIDSALKEMLNH